MNLIDNNENKVVIFLIALIVVGALYNILRKEETDFAICPLCDQKTNYVLNPKSF
jgi:hypothetical protein